MCTKVRIHWTCLACRNRHLPAPLRSISLKLSPLWKYVGSKSCFAEVSCRSCKESSLKSHALHSIFQPHPGEADPHKVARVAQDSTRTYRTSTGIVERSQLCITSFQFRACKAAASASTHALTQNPCNYSAQTAQMHEITPHSLPVFRVASPRCTSSRLLFCED